MPTNKTTTQLQSFVGTGDGASLTVKGDGAAFVEGTFVGTVVLECKPPGAAAFVPVLADTYGTPVSLTAPGSLAIHEAREDTLYRWRCSAFTSGTILTGIAQG